MIIDIENDLPDDLPRTVEAVYLWLSEILAYTTGGATYKQERDPLTGSGMVQQAEAQFFIAGDGTFRFYCAFRPIVEKDYTGIAYSNNWAAVMESITPGERIPSQYRKPA